MKEYSLDMQKMPLGKLSKGQLKKGEISRKFPDPTLLPDSIYNAYSLLLGFEVLKELEEALKAAKFTQGAMNGFSNQFYTMIPHNFGMKAPTILNSLELVKQKRYDISQDVALSIHHVTYIFMTSFCHDIAHVIMSI